MQQQTLIIPARFNGPPEIANGGIVVGALAETIDSPCCTVTLKAPTPLDTPLVVKMHEDGSQGLYLEDALLATSEKADALTISVPDFLPAEKAAETLDQYRELDSVGMGECFVCGSNRHDGLRVFATETKNDPTIYAAKFPMHQDFLDENGNVQPLFLYAALDCPGYFALTKGADYALLGRMTAEIMAPCKGESEATVLAWEIAKNGRKLTAGTAIYDSEGTLVAKALSVWIKVDPQ